jgi:hypothetical protein
MTTEKTTEETALTPCRICRQPRGGGAIDIGPDTDGKPVVICYGCYVEKFT